MKFTIGERILLTTNLIPSQGSMTEMIIVRDLQNKVGINQSDIVKHKIHEKPGPDNRKILNWEETGDFYDIEFTSLELDLLKKTVKLLDEKKMITLQLLPLLEKLDIMM